MIGAWRSLRSWWDGRCESHIAIEERLWEEAEYELPFLDILDADERRRLRALAGRFIATKEWGGAQGLALTAHMQISIALQACLPILNLGLDWYRGWVGIIVYPGDFVIPRQMHDVDGIVHEFDDTVLGEAWEGGPVLLSWFPDLSAVGDVNIVIHEFAHKLDMSNGAIDGMPALHADMRASDWVAAFQPAYADFCGRVDCGVETLIDPYAAENPGEFFAVVSEVFFEVPNLLKAEYPEVFEQLSRFYRFQPLRGTPGDTTPGMAA